MTRSPQLRINDIVRASHKLQELTQDRSAFFDSEVLQDAAAYNILIIGEACNAFSDQFKEELSSIPWTAIRGMRNLLAHEYFVIDVKILFHTASVEIPKLVEQLLSSDLSGSD